MRCLALCCTSWYPGSVCIRRGRPRLFEDLSGFLDEHFAYCAGRFVPGPVDTGSSIACSDLLLADRFDAAVTPLLRRYPDIDRRAVLSVWSMYYFSHLTIGPMVLWLVFRRGTALGPDALGLQLDPQTGLPDRIEMHGAATSPQVTTIHDAFAGLVFDHAAPVVDRLVDRGLSPRLVWSNLAVYIEWIARALGDRIDADLANEGLSLLDCAIWPDGRRNPLHGLVYRSSVEPDAFTRRRVCCLRYLLPDMPGCGMVCSLPAGRD